MKKRKWEGEGEETGKRGGKTGGVASWLLGDGRPWY